MKRMEVVWGERGRERRKLKWNEMECNEWIFISEGNVFLIEFSDNMSLFPDMIQYFESYFINSYIINDYSRVHVFEVYFRVASLTWAIKKGALWKFITISINEKLNILIIIRRRSARA